MKPALNYFFMYIGNFIQTVKFRNLFKRCWGTKTIDGVEVFNREHRIYPRSYLDNNKGLVEFMKYTKSYDSTVSGFGQMNGIDAIYMYLNPNKLKVGSILTDGMISEQLEDIFKVNKEYKMTLSFKETKAIKNMNKTEMLAYFAQPGSWLAILNSDAQIQSTDASNEDDKYQSWYKFVMFDLLNDESAGERDFDISIDSVSSAYTKEIVEDTDSEGYTTSYTILVPTVALDIRFKRIGSININSEVITAIKNPKSVDRIQTTDSEGNVSYETVTTYFSERSEPYQNLFYKGHLRTAVLDPSFVGFDQRVFHKLIQILFDTRYVEKKVKWYKKALIMIVAIVIIVATCSTGAGCLAGTEASMALLATAFLYASIALTLMSMYLAKHGQPGMAQYAAKGAKTSGVVATIIGVYNIIRSGWDAWYKNMTASWTAKATFALQILNIVAPMYYKNQIDNITDDIATLERENEKVERAIAVMSDSDLPLAKTLTAEQMNPLHMQESEMDYDRRYEPTGKWNEQNSTKVYEGGCNICASDGYPSIITSKS